MLVLAVDEPERERLEAQVDHAGLRPSVLFTGFLDQPCLIGPYKAADLLLSTSKTGTQGLILAAARPGNTRGGHREDRSPRRGPRQSERPPGRPRGAREASTGALRSAPHKTRLAASWNLRRESSSESGTAPLVL